MKLPKSILVLTPRRTGMHWLGRVLRYCFDGRIKKRTKGTFPSVEKMVAGERAQRGGALYLSHATFGETRAIAQFVDTIALIRDPRDQVVSLAYAVLIPKFQSEYPWAKGLSFDDTLSKLLWDNSSLHLGLWWLRQYCQERESRFHVLIKYENMLNCPVRTVRRFFEETRRPIPDKTYIKNALKKHSFINFTKGRMLGQENKLDHYRKGVAGDWVNYLTKADNERFCKLYGDILDCLEYSRKYE